LPTWIVSILDGTPNDFANSCMHGGLNSMTGGPAQWGEPSAAIPLSYGYPLIIPNQIVTAVGPTSRPICIFRHSKPLLFWSWESELNRGDWTTTDAYGNKTGAAFPPGSKAELTGNTFEKISRPTVSGDHAAIDFVSSGLLQRGSPKRQLALGVLTFPASRSRSLITIPMQTKARRVPRHSSHGILISAVPVGEALAIGGIVEPTGWRFGLVFFQDIWMMLSTMPIPSQGGFRHQHIMAHQDLGVFCDDV